MNLTWLVTRGSGLAAYAMLAMATIWGLLVSTKVLGRTVNAKGLNWFHESVGLAGILATIAHLVALGMDEYVHFGAAELLIPGASTWRSLAVSMGVMAFYASLFVAFSFYVKRWIGQEWWRRLHYLSFGAFAAATGHGVMAGTDTQHPLVFTMYVTASIAVACLVVLRADSTAAAHPGGQVARGSRTLTAAPPRDSL